MSGESAVGIEETGAPAGDEYRVGPGRPPRAMRWQPGTSGNPAGRPRRAVVAAGRSAGRVVPAEPTELEAALALPVLCLAVDPSDPVSLPRAIVARLTERALANGDVSACRELLRLCAEADALGAERAMLAAERSRAEAEAEHEAAEAAAKAARLAETHAQDAARAELDEMVEVAAEDAGEALTPDDDRALKLLDAVEFEGKNMRVKPWVVEAATAHDPRLPRAGDIRPLDLEDGWDALRRLEVLVEDEDGENALAGWFIDAARARAPKAKLSPGDEALLLLLRVDEGEPDWVARLAAVEGPGGAVDGR